MSVTRYKVEELECCFQADMVESPTGEYVEYADYERLQDTLQCSFNSCRALRDENARLKAEVERLRKAGDALVGEGGTMAHEVSWVPYTWDNLVCDWNDAKEGKQP